MINLNDSVLIFDDSNQSIKTTKQFKEEKSGS